MAQMVRKQIYIKQEHDKGLKNKARKLRKTEAELIREGISHILKEAYIYKDKTAWSVEKKFIQSLIKKGPLKGKRRWTREDIYDRKISGRH